MSGRRRRQVTIGELWDHAPAGPLDIVAEPLRDRLTRDVKAARLAIIEGAIRRKYRRETPAGVSPQAYASRTATVELLGKLPRPANRTELVTRMLMSIHAGWIDSAARTVPVESPADAIDALESLRNNALKLGPLAGETLARVRALLKGLQPLADDRGGGPWLVDEIDAAIDVLERQAEGARGMGDRRSRGPRIAVAVALAYADIVGELPPLTNPYSAAREGPYHRLMRRVFERHQQEHWQGPAKIAAADLRKRAARRELEHEK